MESKLTKRQVKTFQKEIMYEDKPAVMTVEIRYDDKCGNGHNTFSITGNIRYPNRHDSETCGCIHDKIEKHFPEFAHLIKWHSFTSEGPTYYIENTLYLASDVDCWGHRKGEPRSFDTCVKFGGFPILRKVESTLIKTVKQANDSKNKIAFWKSLEVQAVEHGGDGYHYAPRYKFNNMGELRWADCPFDTELDAKEFIEAAIHCGGNVCLIDKPVSFSDGKEPEPENARHSAVWPEATLEQLRDKDLLLARLPKLIEDFRKDIEAEPLNFTF